MNIKTFSLACGLAVHLLAQPAVAGLLEDAMAAYKRGDYVTAAELMRPLAEQGDAMAQNHLGGLYTNGQSVPQDHGETARWFRKSAEQGNASAQNSLGRFYALGKGVAQDYVQAHMWLNLATVAGNEKAAEARDNIAKRMTPEQIAEAQRMAREWLAAHPKK